MASPRWKALEQYRLEQETPKSVHLDVVGEDGQGKRAARDAGDILQCIFGWGVNIVVSEVPALQPEKSGKFLLVKRDFPLDPGVATARTEVLHG